MNLYNRFIALEGLDGSGKSVQFQLLIDYFNKNDLKYKAVHFPRYSESPYGELVGRYLKGEFGSVNNVSPYIAGLLFALDRLETSTQILQWLYQGFFVLVDRYVYSNIAFQCGKLNNPLEKQALQKWIIDLEFNYNRLPKPTLSLFLYVPLPFVSSNLRKDRVGDDRSYLGGKSDIHEIDLRLQEKVHKEYLSLIKINEDFISIDCFSDSNERVLSPGEIHEKIIRNLVERNVI